MANSFSAKNLVSMRHQQWPLRWQQLATMLDAGLTVERSLRALSDSGAKPDATLTRLIGLVQRGVSLPDAVERAGCMSQFDVALLRSAESAGQLPNGLQFIAERRRTQIARVATLSTALWLPQCVLLIGALVAMLLRVFRGTADLIAMLEIVAVVVLVRLATVIFLALLRVDSRVYISILWVVGWLHQHSPLFQISFESIFYRSFLWQIRAGVSAQQAAERCAGLLGSARFGRSVRRAAASMGGGISVTESLEQQSLLLSSRLRTVLAIAEESGRWEQAIDHELDLQQQIIKQKLAAAFTWIPRVYYVFVLVIITGLMR